MARAATTERVGHATQDCFFCHRANNRATVVGGALYEDDLLFASHNYDEGQVYLGSLLIETKRHVPTIAELTDAEAQGLGQLEARLGRALKVCVGAEKIYVMAFAEVFPHVHVYVTARYPSTPPEYWRMRVNEWPDAPRGGAEEVSALCERLREYLRGAS